MSSLLIEGMDMPTDCAGCDLSYYRDGYNGGYGYSPSGWRCRRLNHIIKEGEETRPLDCPLVEVPTPHGRLIDADELVDLLRKEVCLGCSIGMDGAAFSQRCLGCVTLTMYGIVNNLSKAIIEEVKF